MKTIFIGVFLHAHGDLCEGIDHDQIGLKVNYCQGRNEQVNLFGISNIVWFDNERHIILVDSKTTRTSI